MREIKFRAWDKTNKRMMVFGKFWICEIYKSLAWNICDYSKNENDGKYFLDWDIDNLEIMQFTGLLDKNGVDIYEGDIFNIGDSNIKYMVDWFDCGLKGRQLGNKSWVGLDYWRELIEIVGNVHQHPDLLKERT